MEVLLLCVSFRQLCLPGDATGTAGGWHPSEPASGPQSTWPLRVVHGAARPCPSPHGASAAHLGKAAESAGAPEAHLLGQRHRVQVPEDLSLADWPPPHRLTK